MEYERRENLRLFFGSLYRGILLTYLWIAMMKIFVLLVILFTAQEVPLKPQKEFEVKLDYQFKQRPTADKNTVRLGETLKEYERRSSVGVLPYLMLNIRLIELQEDKMRMRVTTNTADRAISKKVSEGQVVNLDLGFTDDMVDRVTAHEYTITFYNSSKQAVDRILIAVDKDGAFFVNGETRGKF